MLNVPESFSETPHTKQKPNQTFPGADGRGDGTPDFAVVVPHLNDDLVGDVGIRHLDEAVAGILAQTTDAWRLILIDDASPSEPAHAQLDRLADLDPRIVVLREPRHRGPGHCRNVGIAYAWSERIPIVVFNDADDISPPRRLEVCGEIFANEPDTMVVYSHFGTIDQEGAPVDRTQLTPSIYEILEALETDPPEGENVWIDIATRTGYVNLTSSTAVRTAHAYSYPFPDEIVSEDLHTWFRYSAAGGSFRFTDEVPCLYRIRLGGAGSASRDRAGGAAAFYDLKLKNDIDGFVRAIELAISRGSVDPSERLELLSRFYERSATSLADEGQTQLAQWALERAAKPSFDRATR